MISPTMPASLTSVEARSMSMHQAARDLETAFLTEMLQSAGFGKMPGTFNGGAGEEQFQSLLTDAKARALMAAGGLGLADKIATALDRQNREAQP